MFKSANISKKVQSGYIAQRHIMCKRRKPKKQKTFPSESKRNKWVSSQCKRQKTQRSRNATKTKKQKTKILQERPQKSISPALHISLFSCSPFFKYTSLMGKT